MWTLTSDFHQPIAWRRTYQKPSEGLNFLAQVMALDCIVVATAIAAWLETKRLPKGKVHLSRWLKFALWTGYMIALLAISFYILILGLLREVVFAESSSRYTGTFWALEFSAAYFAGLQFATYGNNTLQSGKPDMQYLMSLLEASQQLMNETKALLDAAESSQESADKPETDVHEANVKVVV